MRRRRKRRNRLHYYLLLLLLLLLEGWLWRGESSGCLRNLLPLLLTEARECFESAPERTFCLSAKVIIQGLHSRPELNGQSAVINGLSSNSTGRFSLVTASGEVLKIKPANLVLASTSPAPSQSQSQATTVEPMHSVKGLPAGWT